MGFWSVWGRIIWGIYTLNEGRVWVNNEMMMSRATDINQTTMRDTDTDNKHTHLHTYTHMANKHKGNPLDIRGHSRIIPPLNTNTPFCPACLEIFLYFHCQRSKQRVRIISHSSARTRHVLCLIGCVTYMPRMPSSFFVVTVAISGAVSTSLPGFVWGI